MLYRLTIYRQVADAVKLNGVLSCRGRFAPCARDHSQGFNCNDCMRHARRSLRSLSRKLFNCKSYPFSLSFATLTREKLRQSQLRLNGSVFYASQTLRFLRRFVAYALCLQGEHRSSFAPVANANGVCTPLKGLGKVGLTRQSRRELKSIKIQLTLLNLLTNFASKIK